VGVTLLVAQCRPPSDRYIDTGGTDLDRTGGRSGGGPHLSSPLAVAPMKHAVAQLAGSKRDEVLQEFGRPGSRWSTPSRSATRAHIVAVADEHHRGIRAARTQARLL